MPRPGSGPVDRRRTQQAPAGHPHGHEEIRTVTRKPGRCDTSTLHHLDVDDPPLDALTGRGVLRVVVGLDETQPVVGRGGEEAVEVDHLIAFDGGPAAVVLPVTHLDDRAVADVHDRARTAG